MRKVQKRSREEEEKKEERKMRRRGRRREQIRRIRDRLNDAERSEKIMRTRLRWNPT